MLLSSYFDSASQSFVAHSPALAVYAAAAEHDQRFVPAMRQMVARSPNPASRVAIYTGTAHGTELFATDPAIEPAIVSWFTTTLP